MLMVDFHFNVFECPSNSFTQINIAGSFYLLRSSNLNLDPANVSCPLLSTEYDSRNFGLFLQFAQSQFHHYKIIKVPRYFIRTLFQTCFSESSNIARIMYLLQKWFRSRAMPREPQVQIIFYKSRIPAQVSDSLIAKLFSWHSSEKRGLCLMKSSSKTLQTLPYIIPRH